jgi:hypothetical protein
MAQHKEKASGFSLFSGSSFWFKFFAVLFVIDLIFILQIIHALFIFPQWPVGVLSVEIIALFGVYIIYVLSILHIIALLVYLFAIKPQDWRLAVSMLVIVAGFFLLDKYAFLNTVRGISENMSIPIESTISKKTALRLLQECRVNDLVITQKYGAKLTFFTLSPDHPRIKTVYLEEKDIAEFHAAVKEKGDACGEPITIYNDGTVKAVPQE